jgi:hypothetical protein
MILNREQTWKTIDGFDQQQIVLPTFDYLLRHTCCRTYAHHVTALKRTPRHCAVSRYVGCYARKYRQLILQTNFRYQKVILPLKISERYLRQILQTPWRDCARLKQGKETDREELTKTSAESKVFDYSRIFNTMRKKINTIHPT